MVAYSDSDSEYSSLERRRHLGVYMKANKKPNPYKRNRKKKSAIPVAPPKVPPLPGSYTSGGRVSPHTPEDPIDRGITCVCATSSVQPYLCKRPHRKIFENYSGQQ